METILSIFRFSFMPSPETRALLERGISWKKIILVLVFSSVLFAGFATLVDVLSPGADYFLEAVFLYHLKYLLLLTFFCACILYVTCRIFGGNGSFMAHLGIIVWASVPLYILYYASWFLFYFFAPHDFGALALVPLFASIFFIYGTGLISSTICIVHRFSPGRAFLALVISFIFCLLVWGLLTDSNSLFLILVESFSRGSLL